jgi:hypothetical protein
VGRLGNGIRAVFDKALATAGGNYGGVTAALVRDTLALMEEEGSINLRRRSRQVPLGRFSCVSSVFLPCNCLTRILWCVTAVSRPDVVELPPSEAEEAADNGGAAAAALLSDSQNPALDPAALAEVGLQEAVSKAERGGKALEAKGLKWARSLALSIKAKEARDEERRLAEEAEAKADRRREERRKRKAERRKEEAAVKRKRVEPCEEDDEFTPPVQRTPVKGRHVVVPELRNALVKLYGLVIAAGERPDVCVVWDKLLQDLGDGDMHTTWRSPYLSIDAEHRDVPGAPGVSAAPGRVGWLTGSGIGLSLACALHLAPCPDVWLLPDRDYNAAVVGGTGGYLVDECEALVRTHADKGWMVTWQNTTPPVCQLQAELNAGDVAVDGEGLVYHWQLLLYNTPHHTLYIVDALKDVVDLSDARRKFFAGLQPSRTLRVVEAHGLGVQVDGASCGCHVVAAFLIWLGGGNVSDMRKTMNDEGSRDVTMALLRFGAFMRVIGPDTWVAPHVLSKLESAKAAVKRSIRGLKKKVGAYLCLHLRLARGMYDCMLSMLFSLADGINTGISSSGTGRTGRTRCITSGSSW